MVRARGTRNGDIDRAFDPKIAATRGPGRLTDFPKLSSDEAEKRRRV